MDKQLILACHFTGIYDVNRNTTLKDDDYSIVQAWAESIAAQQLKGIIFHNNFTTATCSKYQNEYLDFIKIEHNTRYNPNVYRYLIYRDFLRAHSAALESVFVTDVSDVVTLSNPFIHPFFTENPAAIFCGDEPKPLHNEWMEAHSVHLRTKIAGYAAYEAAFKDSPLLNCGIIGGNIRVIQAFLEKLAGIHEQFNHDNQTAYTGDMGAFNYLMHTQFNDLVLHGSPVNTIFKGYELDRTDCWFRHK